MQLKFIFINIFIQLKGLGVVEFLKFSVCKEDSGRFRFVYKITEHSQNLIAIWAMI